MTKYRVLVELQLCVVLEVDADSEDDAWERVRSMQADEIVEAGEIVNDELRIVRADQEGTIN